MIAFGKFVVGTAVVASLLAGCSSHPSRPAIIASPSASVPPVAPDSCTTPQPTANPVAITPRTDGIYIGTEAGNHPVGVHYYSNHEVYYGVGRTDASTHELQRWLTRQYSSANGNITGPWMYDNAGTFNKPNTKGELNKFTVWKYAGTSLNLHIVSTFGCHQSGTVHEETIFMTFVADSKS